MNRVKSLWREPLLHFLLIGIALFAIYDVRQDTAGQAPNRIVVDANQVQQLVARFQRTWLRPPTQEELSGLIDNCVREEVYYREALAMGLDQNDPQVRQRLRLKLEFILEDLSVEEPGDDVLARFLRRHADRFRLPSRVSFIQLYLNPDKRRNLAADGRIMLASLNHGTAPDSLGDPTLVQYRYTLATGNEIARSLGRSFAREVMNLKPGVWQGPVYSGLGGHLVLVTERREGHLPELAEVREQVKREYLAERRRQQKELAYRKLRQKYEVIIEPLPAGQGVTDKTLAVAARGGEK